MSDKQLSVGVDLGGTNVQIDVVDRQRKTLASVKKKTKPELGTDGVIDRIVEIIDQALEQAKASRGDVAGVGVGAPGAIDVSKGVVLTAVNLRWNNVPLAKAMEKRLGLPVFVDNDVNVGTWGEFTAGAATKHKFQDMLGVFVGTGIGGGLVLGGQLYRGHYRTAGEIGHTLVLANGPLGRRTLENCASRTAVVNLLRELIAANHPSELLELTDGDLSNIRSKMLKQAVKDKDPLTVQVLKQSAHYVGASVANTVTMLSLPLVVIGGGVAEALGQVYVDWVRESFDRFVFPSELKKCQIVLSGLGDHAGSMGAALLAADRVSESER